MSEYASDYGLWSLVIINSAVFIIFAFSFFKPRTAMDWRSFSRAQLTVRWVIERSPLT